jgi:hypothetical protein
MVPAFWIRVGNVRRYGRQLREYLENVWGMCQCRGACFFAVDGNISGLRDTIKRICNEYGGKCASIMVPVFWIWVGNVRRYGRQLRKYLENVWGMCQCRGACFFDVGGNISSLRETIKKICCEYGGNRLASWCLLLDLGGTFS